jgi:hypothetical protein
LAVQVSLAAVGLDWREGFRGEETVVGSVIAEYRERHDSGE